MKRILISQRIDYFSKRNERRDALDINLSNIIINLGFLPIPLTNSFGNLKKNKLINYIDSLKPHGIILSGGNNINEYEKRDFLENTLIEYSIKNSKPLLGICRGMQMIGNFFGSGIEPINNHVNKEIFISGKINKKIKCFHEYKISKCPKDFSIIATAKDGCIEAIKSNKYSILGIMWHFERDNKLDNIDKNLILELFK